MAMLADWQSTANINIELGQDVDLLSWLRGSTRLRSACHFGRVSMHDHVPCMRSSAVAATVGDPCKRDLHDADEKDAAKAPGAAGVSSSFMQRGSGVHSPPSSFVCCISHPPCRIVGCLLLPI
ncbi:hypothetical protein K461DRAFT_281320 [Myriangium duriaei CBS 260.36]|uniref:Uncharacterized protein n=1 Tax=Myriangium duriaei CBS 260.36 TaxID=1168546 RepID=A0A9P4IYB7_9PEZI|nr:hypothetical protein K461DRAFT_281320 [Myriangium duriaei CBS 260.36]